MKIQFRKKGQMKIQQMAFMLLAVTLLFVLAGMAFLVIKMGDLRESAQLAKERDANLLILKLANSPEFACGASLGNPKTGCIDEDKIMILSQEKNINKYKNFWGVSKIEIRRLYPSENKKVICNIGNYPNCEIIGVLEKGESGFSSSNFVSLCRKASLNGEIYDKCDIARLIIWPENVR